MERCMSPQTLVRRVEKLEERVTILEQLPDRIDDLTLQVSQLRDEMRGEFSAVREEMRAGDEETRHQMRVLHEDIIARLTLLQEARGARAQPAKRRKHR